MIPFAALLANSSFRWVAAISVVAIALYGYHSWVVTGLERTIAEKTKDIAKLTADNKVLYNGTVVQNAEIDRLHETTLKYSGLLSEVSAKNAAVHAASEKKIFDFINRKTPIPKDCVGAVSVLKESIRSSALEW